MRNKLLQNFSARFARLLVYAYTCLWLLPYIKNGSYLGNFNSSVLHIPHNNFPYQKSWWKVQVDVVTPQELKMVCGESYEINGEKIVLCRITKKKNCLLLIRSEKIVRLSWELQKKV